MPAVERAILGAVHARQTELEAKRERRRERDPAAGRLACVAVGLVVEMERLDHGRAVGQRAGDDEHVVRAEPAPQLDADRRADRVARDQRRRDAEALIRLAHRVFDADHGIELADEDRRPPLGADQPFQLGQVHIEHVAEAKVGARAGHEVDARRAEDAGRQRAVQRQVHLVDDEAGRAVRVDQVRAIRARRIAEIRRLAARVDRRRQQVAQEHPAVAARVFGKNARVGRAEILDVATAVALRHEEADVGVPGQRGGRLAADDHAAQLAHLFLELLVVLVSERLPGGRGIRVPRRPRRRLRRETAAGPPAEAAHPRPGPMKAAGPPARRRWSPRLPRPAPALPGSSRAR